MCKLMKYSDWKFKRRKIWAAGGCAQGPWCGDLQLEPTEFEQELCSFFSPHCEVRDGGMETGVGAERTKVTQMQSVLPVALFILAEVSVYAGPHCPRVRDGRGSAFWETQWMPSRSERFLESCPHPMWNQRPGCEGLINAKRWAKGPAAQAQSRQQQASQGQDSPTNFYSNFNAQVQCPSSAKTFSTFPKPSVLIHPRN